MRDEEIARVARVKIWYRKWRRRWRRVFVGHFKMYARVSIWSNGSVVCGKRCLHELTTVYFVWHYCPISSIVIWTLTCRKIVFIWVIVILVHETYLQILTFFFIFRLFSIIKSFAHLVLKNVVVTPMDKYCLATKEIHFDLRFQLPFLTFSWPVSERLKTVFGWK